MVIPLPELLFILPTMFKSTKLKHSCCPLRISSYQFLCTYHHIYIGTHCCIKPEVDIEYHTRRRRRRFFFSLSATLPQLLHSLPPLCSLLILLHTLSHSHLRFSFSTTPRTSKNCVHLPRVYTLSHWKRKSENELTISKKIKKRFILKFEVKINIRGVREILYALYTSADAPRRASLSNSKMYTREVAALPASSRSGSRSVRS